MMGHVSKFNAATKSFMASVPHSDLRDVFTRVYPDLSALRSSGSGEVAARSMPPSIRRT